MYRDLLSIFDIRYRESKDDLKQQSLLFRPHNFSETSVTSFTHRSTVRV